MPRLVLLLLLAPVPAFAQAPAATVSRTPFVAAGVGYGTTWDDEGLLGRGAAVSGGVGIHLTPRLWLMGFVDRVRYDRDVEWLAFDGRVLFAGGEMGWRFRDAGASPFVTIGAGALNDSGIWVRKNVAAPGQPRIDEIVDRRGTRATLTAAVGGEFPVAARFSIRGGVRVYGLLQTGDDLFPHLMLQPMGAAVFVF